MPVTLGPLGVLLDDPGSSAVLTDFDGTLAPIVEDPDAAAPLPGAAEVLGELADRFAVVAVVSGRPAEFLRRTLAPAGPAVHLVGVYGLEWVEGDEVRQAPEGAPWHAGARRIVDAATAEFAGGPVGVEDKGAAVTVHWRRAPHAAAEVRAFARDWAARTGFELLMGRRAVELRAPVPIDKGTVTERLGRGCAAACFMGDDAGDLAAFAGLDRLARAGTRAVRVAVSDVESPPALAAAADVVVPGPADALALLSLLARGVGR